MKTFLRYALPLGLAGFLLWLAYKDMDFGQMWTDIQKAHIIPIVLTFITTMLAHLFRALRWNMLFHPVGYQPSVKSSFLAVMSGYFANLIIPRAGEVTRCTVLTTSEKIPIQTSIGTVLAERGLDLVMLGLIALTAFAVEYQTLSDFLIAQKAKFGSPASSDGYDLKIIFLSAIVLFGGLLFIFRKVLMQIPFVAKVLEFIKGLVDGLLSVTRLRNPVLFLVYTILIWGGYYFTTYFSLSMFDFTFDLGFKAAFMLLIIGSFGIVVPVPGAVGGPFQLFVGAALVELYMKEPNISFTAASMMYWTQTFFTLVVGGLCYLLSVVMANQKIDEEKPVEAHV